MMSFTAEDETFTMPLTLKAHQLADQFRQQQPTTQKAKQVYLNTLAVQAVSAYLSWFGIETDIEASDSWNPAMQSLADIADLVTPQGKLECRPVLPGEQSCRVPPEVWSDRVGYVAVQFNADLSEATLLGFAPSVAAMQVPLNHLRSLEELVGNLVEPAPIPLSKAPTQLGQWLQGIIESGWQTIDNLLGVSQPVLSFRSAQQLQSGAESAVSAVRGKLLELYQQSEAEQVALFVGITPTEQPAMNIQVMVHPTGKQTHLPAALEVLILDATGVPVMQAQARTTEMIQLNFSGLPGECFSLKVVLDAVSITETFII